MKDLRDEIFQSLEGKTTRAAVTSEGHGIVAGIDSAKQAVQHLGLVLEEAVAEGARVTPGQSLMTVHGAVKPIIIAEERLMSCISKPSGIASAADKFVRSAGDRPRIVSGAWKKMPSEFKDSLRQAVQVGGAGIRICDEPFLYLDKNYISVFGGIRETLEGVSHMQGYAKVIQLRGKYGEIGLEAREAARMNAEILFVDTGELNDVESVTRALEEAGTRDQVKIAFGGNISISQLEKIRGLDVDILDIGKAIVDAPLLDLKYEVQEVEKG